MKPTLPRYIFGVVLALALSIGAVPAAADPPPPEDPCLGEYINGFCSLGTPPYAHFEDPPPPPIPQSGDTGTDGEDAVASSWYGGCVERSASLGSYTVVHKSCLELKEHIGGPGEDSRLKTRFTFWYNGPAGTVPAYGNVRWATSWSPTPTRRAYWWVLNTRHYYSYTRNRSDAIQVHTTVAYSNWGCSNVVQSWHYGSVANHYVRMPQGTLFGPFGQRTNGVMNTCLP